MLPGLWALALIGSEIDLEGCESCESAYNYKLTVRKYSHRQFELFEQIEMQCLAKVRVASKLQCIDMKLAQASFIVQRTSTLPTTALCGTWNP